jgi:tRNA/rRNA methyltransferase
MHRSAPEWFERLAFVLVRPSHPGNVGAVARAMRTMGLRRLIVVAPPDPGVLSDPQAVARASGADAVLHEARLEPDLASALAPFSLAVAVSAAGREFGPQPEPPEPSVHAVREELLRDAEARVAFVFGPERTGLSVEDAGACQRLCSIPGDDEYNSLNLAQAAQIIAYCLRALERLEPLDARAQEPSVEAARFASLGEVEGVFRHLEEALVRIGFLDPAHPKKLMARMRRLFSRTRLEPEEVAILRGICTQIEKLADGDIHGPRRRPGVHGGGGESASGPSAGGQSAAGRGDRQQDR